MPDERAICVPLLRAKEETLWPAKLDRSSHEAIADGSCGSISVATTKSRNAITTTELSARLNPVPLHHLERLLEISNVSDSCRCCLDARESLVRDQGSIGRMRLAIAAKTAFLS